MVSFFALGRFLFRFPFGVLVDRFGARPVALAAAAGVAGGAVVGATAAQFWLVLAARVVQGLGVAGVTVAANQHLLRITPRERLGAANALFQTGIVAGASVGPVLGGVAADLGDLRTPFWAQAILAVVLLPVIVRVMRGGTSEVRSVRQSLGVAAGLIRRPLFLGVMALWFALFFLRAGAGNALLPAYADEVAGLSPTAIGFVVSASAVTAVGAMIPTGRLVDRVGRKPVILTGTAALAGSVALYGTTSSLAGLLAVSGLVGLTMGLVSVPPPTMVGDLAAEGTEGVAAGVFRMANDLAWVVGPLVLGWMADAGLWGWGFVVAGLPLLVVGAGFVWAPETGVVKGGRRPGRSEPSSSDASRVDHGAPPREPARGRDGSAEKDRIEAFWEGFARATGATGPYSAWAFGNEAEPGLQTSLGRLVLEGPKRATAGVLEEYREEGEPLPRVGDHSVVLDGEGMPLCVIRTTRVEVRRFGEVDEEFAWVEGEGDRSLRWWRDAHLGAWARRGRAVDDDTLMVLERFELVWPLPAS
jgi:uncharacterized protein YhfF/predicted MFS family arabinose efflux permease